MKHNSLKKQLLSLFFCVILLGSVGVARAAEPAAPDTGKTWDELAAQVIEEAQASTDTVALGYFNTVTGEEHYYNGDHYFFGASLYKLPLNMYCSEQILRGERSWETETLGRSYEEIQISSLTYSNNPLSLQLVNELGGWAGFRARIAPYLGESSEDEDFTQRTTDFTARQITRCTALLANESERFPRVIDCLLDSAPDSFLNYADVPYDIAQKYGNNAEEGNVFHVAGIVYTDDPIVLVVLSANLAAQRTVMERYCELMCDYAQQQRTQRLAGEAEAKRLAEEAEKEAAARKAAEEEAQRLAQEAEAAEAERLATEEAIRAAAEELALQRSLQRKRTLFLSLAALAVGGVCTAAFIFYKRK